MNLYKDKLEKLLDEKEVGKILEKNADDIFGGPVKILSVKIKPFKTYLDSNSYSLAALYEIQTDVSGNIMSEKLFASAHSTPAKEQDYKALQKLSFLSKNPAPNLEIPKSRHFIKSFGLLLRDYVAGDLLKDKLDDNFIKKSALALAEFQKINIFLDFVFELRSNYSDLEKNVEIIEKRGDPASNLIQEDFKDINVQLESLVDAEKHDEKVLSHGDFTPTNIIITPDIKISLIDFGSIGYRHRLWDVAGFCSHIKTTKDSQIDGAVRTQIQNLFLKTYSEATGISFGEKEKRLLKTYGAYFELLIRTHVLVWNTATPFL
ncbi:MAG: aminoglycoside phosphotransferase family protein [Candidatus Paceibacterota bacterium]